MHVRVRVLFHFIFVKLHLTISQPNKILMSLSSLSISSGSRTIKTHKRWEKKIGKQVYSISVLISTFSFWKSSSRVKVTYFNRNINKWRKKQQQQRKSKSTWLKGTRSSVAILLHFQFGCFLFPSIDLSTNIYITHSCLYIYPFICRLVCVSIYLSSSL